MAFKSVLTDQQKRALLQDYEDGWSINDISVIYKVSISTVYRTLALYNAPKRVKHKRNVRRKVTHASKPRVLKPCGTNAAYKRHKAHGEYPCTECLDAHAADVQMWKEKAKNKLEAAERRKARKRVKK